jgi:prepilin-type N-terminal cleavage/methylation domain-containing protein
MRQDAQQGTKGERLRRSRHERMHAHGARSAGDEGFTLVEVVITITLIALTIVPILDATFTSIKASATAREVAEVETVLQNAADRVNRADPLCDYKIYVEAAAIAKGWDATQASATYQYYLPGANALASSPGAWTVSGSNPTDACPGGNRSARLIQLVTITVRSDSGSINRTIQVVKSDV